jgi:hypothetical protein
MKIPVSVHVWIVAYLLTVSVSFGRVLTHGPVVGGVTDTGAKVFVRTDDNAGVELFDLRSIHHRCHE